MKPKKPGSVQKSLFPTQPYLDSFINMKHPLVKMADNMQWDQFDVHWASLFSTDGGPVGTPSRMVAGLFMLKHMEALSDERLLEQWVANPYYQYFCGELTFQHKPPVVPTALVKWRHRLGEEGMEWLLSTVIGSAIDSGALNQQSIAHLAVDSTVMEKHIAHPTDSQLLENLRKKLVRFMKENQLTLRQSYAKSGPRIAQQIARYAHAKQFKRMRREIRKLRGFVGRLMRELQRQMERVDIDQREKAEQLLDQARRLIEQSKNAKMKNKLYSLHEPAVDCISKGKAKKRYEFGCKVSVASTQKEGYVVGIRSFAGNPYDGHTLDEQLEQVEILTDVAARTVVVDLGYRGRHKTEAEIIHRGKKLTKRQKQRLKRRSTIEGIIGHMKCDGLLSRCHLKGMTGDAIHAVLCGVGHNLRLLRRYWERVLFWLFFMCQGREKPVLWAA